MTPSLMHRQLADIIHDLELELLQPNVRTSVMRLDELLAEDFLEVGESGRVYTKQSVLSLLPSLPAITYIMHDFNVREISPGMVLATYRVDKELGNNQTSASRRSSLWRNREGRWQMIFHQGTPHGT